VSFCCNYFVGGLKTTNIFLTKTYRAKLIFQERPFYYPLKASEVYSSTQKKATAVEDFVQEVNQDLTMLKPFSNSKYPCTDIGNSNLFADYYKNIARYVPERKHWFMYDGKAWRSDTGGLKVMNLCKKLANKLMLYALSIKDEDTRKLYIDYAKKWQTRRTREIILRDAQDIHPLQMKEFDNDIYLLNCRNGTLNLNDGSFYSHKASDYITKIAGVKYEPDAKCERWEEFIGEIMSGDKEKAEFLQKSLGYRKVKGGCSSHQIRNVVVEQLLLEDLQRITLFAKEHESEFLCLVTNSSKKATDKELKGCQREYEQAQARILALDNIIQRLYEDNIVGKISDERFAKMSATYEIEQKQLENRVLELKDVIESTQEKSLNAEHFLNLVKKYTDIRELGAEIIREFVEKIIVFKAEKENGHRVQRIQIIYNCIGAVEIPSKQEKTA